MVIDRRRLLGGASAGMVLAATGLGACSADRVPGTSYPDACVASDSLTPFTALGGAELVYEVDGSGSRFFIDDGFAAQLEAWLADWRVLAGAPAVGRLRTYGSWIDGTGEGCRSWHHAGRAFDVAGLEDGGGNLLASARYDVWDTFEGGERRRLELRYWALAASLHQHFAYVLTYLTDPLHHNHLHVDNGRSGAEMSVFDRRSGSQVQAVRAMCRLVWDTDLPDGEDYDGDTRAAVRDVLADHGGGSLSDGDGWPRFLRATAERATRLSAS